MHPHLIHILLNLELKLDGQEGRYKKVKKQIEVNVERPARDLRI